MVRDMTDGKPLKLIMAFSLPLLLGNLLQQFYSMADSAVVGRSAGYKALGSIGITVGVIQLLLGLAQGLAGGLSIVTAQRFGAGDTNGVKKSVSMGLLLCGLAAAAITAAGIFLTEPLFLLIGTPDDIIDGAVLYSRILFIGAATTIFFNMLSGTIRALGDSKTPVLFLAIAALLNVGLDLLFVPVFSWGIAGAAWATVISQAASGIMCMLYIRRRIPELALKLSDFKIDTAMLKTQLRVGVPMAIHLSVLAIGYLLVQITLNKLGSTIVSSYTTAVKMDNLVFQSLNAFSMAAATFAAQNYGAKKYSRIREGVFISCIIALAISLVICAAFHVFDEGIMRLFVGKEETEVIALGAGYLRTASSFYFLLGLIFILRGTLQGLGKPLIPMITGFCELIFRSGAAYLLTNAFGYNGLCFANPISWLSALIPIIFAYSYVSKRLFNARASGLEY